MNAITTTTRKKKTRNGKDFYGIINESHTTTNTHRKKRSEYTQYYEIIEKTISFQMAIEILISYIEKKKTIRQINILTFEIVIIIIIIIRYRFSLVIRV